MIKIIEYVQGSFCSFRKQETTGHLILELKFFGLKCTLKVWCGYLYILLRTIVNEHKQLSSKVSKNLNCMYLFIVRVSPAIPLCKTQSHKNIWPFHTSRIISKFFHAHVFETFHMKVKSQIPSSFKSQVINDDRMSYIICSRTIRGLVYDFFRSI